MMRVRPPFIALMAAAFLILAVGTAQGANVTPFSGDANEAAWTAAAGSPVITEDFQDETLVPGLLITFGIDLPGTISGGVYHDRANTSQEVKPMFTFSPPIKAFGANWNLFVPTGQGTNIKLFLTFDDTTTLSLGTEIPSTFAGQFFGIVSDTPIVSIRFDEGTQDAAVETFDMDNARFVVAPPVIATIAGDGTVCADPLTACGDGGLATAAQLSDPQAVAVDPLTGDVYIADANNHRVRMVVANGLVNKGKIFTVAGTGIAGFNGDGPAAQKHLNGPTGVAHDGVNLFIVDSNNHLVRRLSGGVLTTVAGSPTTPTKGFTDGPAASARFAFPRSVAVADVETLIIADPNNARIRLVNLTTQTVSSIAGTGLLGLSAENVLATLAVLNGPTGAVVDGSGRILVADQGNNRIRRFPVGGSIETVAGSGIIANAGTGLGGFGGDGFSATAVGTLLDSPTGVTVDGIGNIFIADTANHRIRMVDEGIITTIAGTGAAGFFGGTALNGPSGVAVGPGALVPGASTALFIADPGNQRIRGLVIISLPQGD